MDKIGLQIFRLDSNVNKLQSNEGDIFGALFSIPMLTNNQENKLKEFVFPSKNFDFSDNEKLRKFFNFLHHDKDLHHDKENNSIKSKTEFVDNDEVQNENKNKIIAPIPQNKKIEKKYEFIINFNENFKYKKKISENLKPSDTIKKSDKSHIDEFQKENFLKNSSYKVKSDFSKKNNNNNSQLVIEKPKTLDQVEFNKDANFSDEEHEISLKLERSVSPQKIISVNSEKETSKLYLNKSNDSQTINLNNLGKIEASSQSNQFSHEHTFSNNDRNMHFLLNNFIEELNMTEKGWTEKLIIRLEKALSDGTEEIELFLKPKELGSLKINLQLNKNNAKILFKAENHFVIQALQQNEGFLSKLFNDQGINIETTDYHQNNFNNNGDLNSHKKQDDKKQNIFKENEDEVQKNDEQNETDNKNYIINVNA